MHSDALLDLLAQFPDMVTHNDGQRTLVWQTEADAQNDDGSRAVAVMTIANGQPSVSAPELLAALKKLSRYAREVFDHAKTFERLDGSPVVTEGDMILLDRIDELIHRA